MFVKFIMKLQLWCMLNSYRKLLKFHEKLLNLIKSRISIEIDPSSIYTLHPTDPVIYIKQLSPN